jgi:hypothetical protein
MINRLGSICAAAAKNEITHQESPISADGSDATKTNFMQPELTGRYQCRLYD